MLEDAVFAQDGVFAVRERVKDAAADAVAPVVVGVLDGLWLLVGDRDGPVREIERERKGLSDAVEDGVRDACDVKEAVADTLCCRDCVALREALLNADEDIVFVLLADCMREAVSEPVCVACAVAVGDAVNDGVSDVDKDAVVVLLTSARRLNVGVSDSDDALESDALAVIVDVIEGEADDDLERSREFVKLSVSELLESHDEDTEADVDTVLVWLGCGVLECVSLRDAVTLPVDEGALEFDVDGLSVFDSELERVSLGTGERDKD